MSDCARRHSETQHCGACMDRQYLCTCSSGQQSTKPDLDTYRCLDTYKCLLLTAVGAATAMVLMAALDQGATEFGTSSVAGALMLMINCWTTGGIEAGKAVLQSFWAKPEAKQARALTHTKHQRRKRAAQLRCEQRVQQREDQATVDQAVADSAAVDWLAYETHRPSIKHTPQVTAAWWYHSFPLLFLLSGIPSLDLPLATKPSRRALSRSTPPLQAVLPLSGRHSTRA